MTNKEALAFLSDDVKSQEKAYMTNLEHYGKGDAYTELCIDAIHTAIEALEKQIPKKPVINGNKNVAWVENAMLCPSCLNHAGTNYCTRCGQRLDWRDE